MLSRATSSCEDIEQITSYKSIAIHPHPSPRHYTLHWWKECSRAVYIQTQIMNGISVCVKIANIKIIEYIIEILCRLGLCPCDQGFSFAR